MNAGLRRFREALADLELGPGDLTICSGACGGDLLFAEAALARGVHPRQAATVLPTLRTRLKQMGAAEYAARWEPEFERVEAMRDALAAEMREVYPAAVAQLANLFQRMTECDRECSRIDGLAPHGEHRRLLTVELTARGVDRLWQPDVFIGETLRLPYFTRDNGPIYSWPSATPPLLTSSFIPVPSGPGPDWHQEIEARDAARCEESARVGAIYDAQEREREARNAREATAAHEYEVAERNRQAGRGCITLGDLEQ
jgi:hypothetical protein